MPTVQPSRLVLTFALLFTTSLTAAAKDSVAGPSPAATVLIEELGLRESDNPMADRPGWKPKRIVVMTLPAMGITKETFEPMLRAAAGDIELVIDSTGGFIPSKELLAGADGLMGVCTTPALKAAGPEMRWVHQYFVGMDYCKGYSQNQLRDIIFTNAQRLSGPAIAEHTIAMLLSLSHNFQAFHAAQTKTTWAREEAANVTFGELEGKTMLVVGLGGIGTQVALRAHGLGMRIIATRNSSRSGPDYVEYVGLANELHTLAAKADVIVNALPLTPGTTGLFDKAFFAASKPGAIFLSVGRGKSTVTSDLIAALKSGSLFAAGLDVTDPEPLPKDSPLWAMDNVLITPHISAVSAASTQRSMIIAAENLRRYVAGEALLNVVDLHRGY